AATLKEVKGSKEHVSLRIACIIALGQLRATEAKPVIEEMLNDPDQMVREHAKRVLDELSR
ncbi:MAG: HEAT repeat domain-containing protein, partial [Armatimonadota bacterium]|nr:HEAT repeat domain-containing protein [Armatimonadota bacterium]